VLKNSLNQIIEKRNSSKAETEVMEQLLGERHIADLAFSILNIYPSQSYHIPQSGWGTLYWVQSGQCKIEIKKGLVKTVKEGWCITIPGGREHYIHADNDTKYGQNKILLPLDGTCSNGEFHHTEGKTPVARIMRLRVSNSSQIMPGVLPPIIFMDRKQVREIEGLLPLLHLMRDYSGQNDTIRQLLRCRLADALSVLLFAYIIENLDAPVEEIMAEGFDARIKGAISAMHREPSRQWTVASLAGEVNLSRSSFADRFRSVVGETPMVFLSRIRMNLASCYLQSLDWSISEIAQEVGYASEGAFINAFKRHTKISPGKFRRAARFSEPEPRIMSE